jgi:hypothetical protein
MHCSSKFVISETTVAHLQLDSHQNMIKQILLKSFEFVVSEKIFLNFRLSETRIGNGGHVF